LRDGDLTWEPRNTRNMYWFK
jgi:hypothetical protein